MFTARVSDAFDAMSSSSLILSLIHQGRIEYLRSTAFTPTTRGRQMVALLHSTGLLHPEGRLLTNGSTTETTSVQRTGTVIPRSFVGRKSNCANPPRLLLNPRSLPQSHRRGHPSKCLRGLRLQHAARGVIAPQAPSSWATRRTRTLTPRRMSPSHPLQTTSRYPATQWIWSWKTSGRDKWPRHTNDVRESRRPKRLRIFTGPIAKPATCVCRRSRRCTPPRSGRRRRGQRLSLTRRLSWIPWKR